ncbi:Actin-related protein 2/3 complex subunit 5 [Thelohanellus kitauei]|uniref:Actin-related protein 2/3 complex subunit 5 n=1 Tax=Thelohanellus kitauei TaxID=669202 RepID=A0A0C2MR39_THEKT|nr:Actin-related protein 2/3 complex subunit 5 [Thelohanellus kitauei]
MTNVADNRNFRRVDVDKYDENAYQEESSAPTGAFNETEVNSMINSRNYSGAMKAILQSPVICSTNVKEKTALVDAFIRVNTSIKQNNIPELMSSFNDDDKENLIRIIYMSFKVRPEVDHGISHAWFEKAHQDVGHGAIVRAMTDRKSLVFKP